MTDTYRIQFVGETPPDVDEVLVKLKEELDVMYEDVEGRTEDLFYHVVFMTKDHHGPTVFCYGDPDHPGVFFCEYSAITEWETLPGKDTK